MQNAAEWLDRDRTLETVEKGRHAAVDTDQFRNHKIGEGWKASYVVRQPGVGSSAAAERVVDMSSREAVARAKAASKAERKRKKGWVEQYEKSIMPHARDDSSDSSDSSSSSERRKRRKEKKARRKGKKRKKEKKKSKKGKARKKEGAEAPADATRQRLMEYIRAIGEIEDREELVSVCVSERMDPPPATTPVEALRRVLTNHFGSKLRDHLAQASGK